MDKDAISSVAVIALLLVIIVMATIFNSRNELVVSRPDANSVVTKVLNKWFGAETTPPATTDASNNCPLGCEAIPSPQPVANQKQQYQQDPVPYVRDQVEAALNQALKNGEVESVYSLDTNLWWRSDEEGYRIIVPGAKTISFQVPTTQKAYQLAPGKDNELHPARRHPMLEQAEKEISKALKKIDFKQGNFSRCPIDDAYDPFDNCVATFTKGKQRCLLSASYGQFNQPASTSDPYLRLDLTCSDNYEWAYNQEAPYLYAIDIINPRWSIPDMAVSQIATDDNKQLTWVDFGTHQAYFQHLENGLRLLDSEPEGLSCDLLHDPNNTQLLQLHCE
ncbi:hypothetical protein IJJ27_04635 [bacterium]|nr:hypothetical protein [bacterium]